MPDYSLRTTVCVQRSRWALCLWIGLLLIVSPASALQDDPAVVGRWSDVQSWPVVTVHAHLFPTGKVLVWYWDTGYFLWDPVRNKFKRVSDPGYNMFCSGHTSLADGRLFSAGGHEDNGVGFPYASVFDPASNTWARMPDMTAGRWYPTTTALPNGDVLAISGMLTFITGVNQLPEVWQRSTQTWRPLTSALRSLPLYPWMFVAPNGKVFYAGPSTETAYLDTSNTGAWSPLSFPRLEARDHGSAVMYNPGKVLVLGGGEPPTASAEVIDLNSAAPSWRTIQPMSHVRRHANATLLADGSVFVVGGHNSTAFDDPTAGVFVPELWDPETESWTQLAPHRIYRGYHTVSFLLPDARVLVSGGGWVEKTAEIFSPPYLFRGPRPKISSVRKVVTYGEAFLVRTPDRASIEKVTWLRTGSVTHGFDESQSINYLSFTRHRNGLTVTAPADPNVSPPGHYLLFLINSAGVPSLASIIRIDAGTNTAGSVARPLDLVAREARGGGITLTWNDNSANEDGFAIERSSDGATFVEVAALGADSTTFIDHEVVPGVLYSYQVKAYNRTAESTYSNLATAILLSQPRRRK